MFSQIWNFYVGGDGQVTQKVPPLSDPPLKRGSKRLTFFWVHFLHTRSGGDIQTPLTNGGPFCPFLGGDPTPREGGYLLDGRLDRTAWSIRFAISS